MNAKRKKSSKYASATKVLTKAKTSVIAAMKIKVSSWAKRHAIGFVTGAGTVATAAAGAVLAYYIIDYFKEKTTEIERLIENEAMYSLQAPCADKLYGQLFVEKASLKDVRGERWYPGKQAILERYRNLPQFESLYHALDALPVFSGKNSAHVKTTSTMVFDDQPHIGHERWWFVRTDEGWKIKMIHYNLDD